MLIEQFICREDNFAVLIHDEATGRTTAIDAPDANAIEQFLEQRGWSLDMIFITHHHHDHTDGIAALKTATDATIIGPKAESGKIAGLDQLVEEGETLFFANHSIIPIATPGHTAGALCYYFPDDGVVFTGDTLFSLGCGRLFEGTPADMLASLKKLAALPPETQIYCGHEYTRSNGRFALSIDPENTALQNRIHEVENLRAAGQPTLPVTIKTELETNPFLRWHDPEIRANLGLKDATDLTVFSEIRKRKDQF